MTTWTSWTLDYTCSRHAVLEINVDDSDCCYNCLTLLIRLLLTRGKSTKRNKVGLRADTAYKRHDV